MTRTNEGERKRRDKASSMRTNRQCHVKWLVFRLLNSRLHLGEVVQAARTQAQPTAALAHHMKRDISRAAMIDLDTQSGFPMSTIAALRRFWWRTSDEHVLEFGCDGEILELLSLEGHAKRLLVDLCR